MNSGSSPVGLFLSRAWMKKPRSIISEWVWPNSTCTFPAFANGVNRPSASPRLPSVPGTALAQVRDATDGEVADAVAQWCLLTSRQSPNLQTPLRDAARRAIGHAQHVGQSTEPQVFAIAGLVELADGNVEDARTLLESVATYADLNVDARFELARLRFAEANSHLGASGRTFDATQTTAILALLDPFLWQPPGSSDPWN